MKYTQKSKLLWNIAFIGPIVLWMVVFAYMALKVL